MLTCPSSAKARLTLSCALVLFLLTHAAIAPAALALQEGSIAVPDGTEFMVVTTEEINSKTATEGDPLTFKVEDDVKINGKVVIAKGALVKGIVSNASKSGRMGKAGQLSIRIESTTTVDEQKVKLRASKGKEGDDKTGTTVALVVLFGPLGFLKKGKNASIKEGTQIKVYTDEEKRVRA
ncbi:MAG: hypothetical protein MSG64_18120 [Pyrinomonadaceae bacterium MAG19_C2-C3]|nr:hypothetical protein [Pyrinomonadaceae bacterium MAG19_C2-C3]